MDRTTDWPWSWEEEIEWKADLEERKDTFVQELIDNAIEDRAADSRDVLVPPREERSDDARPDPDFVTA